MNQPNRADIEDLGDAISHCEVQLKRLSLNKHSAVIALWLELNGFAGDWQRLDLDGFRNLYRFLRKCQP